MNTSSASALTVRDPWALVPSLGNLDAYITAANRVPLLTHEEEVAYAFVAASLVYYARLSVVFLLSMAVVSAVGLALVHAMGPNVLPISAAIFVLAWIAQFVGHKIEGRKPSFFEDLQYLWVGPLFVLSLLFRKLGVRW